MILLLKKRQAWIEIFNKLLKFVYSLLLFNIVLGFYNIFIFLIKFMYSKIHCSLLIFVILTLKFINLNVDFF